jgi:prepilin-type N-terminal cleavage/methylation domain-containing protein
MKKGFTLIEFIVIISIFAIMASVALFNFSGFRSNVSLNNLAHDIGLVIRQAQVFGWANQSDSLSGNSGVVIDGADTLSGNPVRFSDGVYFDLSTPTTAKQIILYKKNSSTGSPYFIDATQDTVIDTINVSGPNKIGQIAYALNKQDLALDASGNPGPSINIVAPTSGVSISFTRPKPEAMFFDGINPIPTGAIGGASGGDYLGVYIQGDNDTAFSHVIIVSRTGEIDVQ